MYPGLTFHGVWVCEIRGLWVLVTLIGSNERLQARLILDAVRVLLEVHDGPLTPLYTPSLGIFNSINAVELTWGAQLSLIDNNIS